MRDLAFLYISIVLTFITFVIIWNRKFRANVLDEREANLRLRVRVMISRAVEIALVLAICFHVFIRPPTGLEALLQSVLPESFQKLSAIGIYVEEMRRLNSH